MKAAFVINARDKEKHVAKCVQGALAQTYPCHILLSDQQSIDGTYEIMQKTVDEYLEKFVDREDEHKIDVLRCPIEGPYSMSSSNAHFDWLVDQTDAQWIFQCSADDWSLPGRVGACMHAVGAHACVAVGTNMKMLDPQHPEKEQYAGLAESGHVSAGFGLRNLVFGSCIAGYRRDWLKKVGSAGAVTMDVYYGFLASIDEGYYVVAEPHHVHFMAADVNNMGFGGKLRGAELRGDKAEMARLNELNRFQLFELYYKTAERATKLYPMMHEQDRSSLIQSIVDQAVGWYNERKNLHRNGWRPAMMAP